MGRHAKSDKEKGSREEEINETDRRRTSPKFHVQKLGKFGKYLQKILMNISSKIFVCLS